MACLEIGIKNWMGELLSCISVVVAILLVPVKPGGMMLTDTLMAPKQGWLAVLVDCVLSNHAGDLASRDFTQCKAELLSWIKS